MGRKRYHYDSKGRSRGFSSDEGPGSRNAKALAIALPLVAVMSMCGVKIERGSTFSDHQPQQSENDSNFIEDSDARAEDGSHAYVVTGPANLRYDTKATDTPIVGELSPGERIIGEPRKGADSRMWVMITEGPQSGSFVWGGNLRRANNSSQVAPRPLAFKPDVVTPNARNDVDCSVVVLYFDTAFKDQGAPKDQQEMMASLKTWYLKRAQMVSSRRGLEAVEKRAMPLTAPGARNLQIMKEAFAKCTERAVREGFR